MFLIDKNRVHVFKLCTCNTLTTFQSNIFTFGSAMGDKLAKVITPLFEVHFLHLKSYCTKVHDILESLY